MIKQIILLIGPTIGVFVGLSIAQNILLTFFLFYGWLLFIPLLFRFWKKTNRRHIPFSITKKNFVVGIGSGLICLVAIYSFVVVFQYSVINIAELRQQLDVWDFNGTKVILLILVLIFINPILEEFYWREFIHTRLLHKIGTVKTILITSIFYTIYHLIIVLEIFSFPFNTLAVIPVFLAGIMWGIFRIKLNSIAASIISHSLADIGIMLVYWNIILL